MTQSNAFEAALLSISNEIGENATLSYGTSITGAKWVRGYNDIIGKYSNKYFY